MTKLATIIVLGLMADGFLLRWAVGQDCYEMHLRLDDASIRFEQKSHETPPSLFFDRFKKYTTIRFQATDKLCDLQKISKSNVKDNFRSVLLQNCILLEDWIDSVTALANLESLTIEYCESRPLVFADATKLYALSRLSSLTLKGMDLSNEFIDPDIKISPSIKFINFLGCSFNEANIGAFKASHPGVQVIAIWASAGEGDGKQKEILGGGREDATANDGAPVAKSDEGLGGDPRPQDSVLRTIVLRTTVRIQEVRGPTPDSTFFDCFEEFESIEYSANCNCSIDRLGLSQVRNNVSKISFEEDCVLKKGWLETVLSMSNLKSLTFSDSSKLPDAAIRSLLMHSSLQTLVLRDPGVEERHCFDEQLSVSKSLRTIVFLGKASKDSLKKFQSSNPSICVISR